ncbi:MAG: YigZ family protein, partial [Candidatus Poribacteria bacterium]|nr:YigZ family protein [Candidatus Poribacteria bacterium]
MSDEYKTIVSVAESKHLVKKSRFIGLATSVDTIEASKVFLDLAREKYPNASHYCYGYRIGFGGEKREYATDAGEPTNSAGPPILAAVIASELSNVICVVVRYYGGINLGVGGL